MLITTAKPTSSLPSTQPSTTTELVLTDIIKNVKIQADFQVSHPQYQPYVLPQELQERLTKLPAVVQQKYRILVLRNFLYSLYYNGTLESKIALEQDANEQSLDLDNNSFLGIDTAFYAQLHEANTSVGYFEPGWQILDQTNPQGWLVTNGSLRVTIDPEHHVELTQRQATVGDAIAIWLPPNRMQSGFYVALGNTHLEPTVAPGGSAELIRIYFNLRSSGAAPLMQDLTTEFNRLAVPFHFKTLYNPSDYQRRDAAVLYLAPQSYPEFQRWFSRAYADYQDYLKPEVPLFTKQIAPGVGVAEEPSQKFAERESFGQNRCQILAQALVNAIDQGCDQFSERLALIKAEFMQQGISLDAPYLNPDSTDLYLPISG